MKVPIPPLLANV